MWSQFPANKRQSSLFLSTRTPGAIASDQNDFDMGAGSMFRLLPSGGSRTITGIVGGQDGRVILIENVGTSYDLLFTNDDAASTNINRIYNGVDGGGTLRLRPNQGIVLAYDGLTLRWRVHHLVQDYDPVSDPMIRALTPTGDPMPPPPYNPVADPVLRSMTPGQSDIYNNLFRRAAPPAAVGTAVGTSLDADYAPGSSVVDILDSFSNPVTVTFLLPTSGDLFIEAWGTYTISSLAAAAFASSTIGVKVNGTDYMFPSTEAQNGSGSDKWLGVLCGGIRKITLNAGTYTATLRGSSTNGGLKAGATIRITFAGASGIVQTIYDPVSDPYLRTITPDAGRKESVKLFSEGSGGTGTAADPLHKNFFSHNSLLPGTTQKEELYDYPAPDFSNLNGGTLTRSMSLAKFTASANPANWGWNAGAAKSTFLMIHMMMRESGSNWGFFLSPTLPGASEVPNNSYLFLLEGSNSRLNVYKVTAGPTYTSLATNTDVFQGTSRNAANVSFAVYYDDASNRIVVFLSFGQEEFWPVIDITDSSFTTFQYWGLRAGVAGATIFKAGCPIACYTN